MVTAAYSSGKPAIGVGPGNVPVIMDSTCDIPTAVYSVIHSKTFDNGMICASEQSVTAIADIYDEVRAESVSYTHLDVYKRQRQWCRPVMYSYYINIPSFIQQFLDNLEMKYIL